MTAETWAGLPAGPCARCRRDVDRLIPGYYDKELLCAECVRDDAELYDDIGWPVDVLDTPASPRIATVGCVWNEIILETSEGPFGFSRPGWRRLAVILSSRPMRGRRQLWIERSALERLGLPLELPFRRPSDPPIAHAWLEGLKVEGLAAWMTVDGKEVCVPAWEGRTGSDGVYRNRSPWHLEAAAGPGRLLAELSAFEAALGHRWIRSGAVTSDAMLGAQWKGEIKPAELPDPSFARALELPDHTVRGPDADELVGARFCFGFDLNANYLGAASNLRLPYGPAEHVPGVFPVTQPGYWLTYDRGWRTTQGCNTPHERVVDGYCYAGSHQYLQKWYKVLRDARASLAPGSAALDAVKAVYQMGPGRLGSTRRGSSPFAQRLYQPYWSQAVIANARERLRRRIEAMPVVPIAVDTDAIYVLSSLPDARICAGSLGLKLGRDLGQWKVLGRCAAGDAAKIVRADREAILSIDELRQAVKS